MTVPVTVIHATVAPMPSHYYVCISVDYEPPMMQGYGATPFDAWQDYMMQYYSFMEEMHEADISP